ncbi:hypothetical protein PybrP1_012960 [[Pythium] brassicae (nom. inval.)]|nr:hypothetical protein PybrP1_012960 [[Pythium] brassicae (nom. inval.)]
MTRVLETKSEYTSREPQSIRSHFSNPSRHVQVMTFALVFRGEGAGLLASDILALDIQNALHAVESIDQVKVSYSAGAASPAYTLGGTNKITVEFISALRDVPPLRADVKLNAAQILQFTIDCDGVGTSKRGTVENVECSNKGVCIYATGACACFKGMISRDKLNAVGVQEDCGLVQPVEDPLAKNLLLTG